MPSVALPIPLLRAFCGVNWAGGEGGVGEEKGPFVERGGCGCVSEGAKKGQVEEGAGQGLCSRTAPLLGWGCPEGQVQKSTSPSTRNAQLDALTKCFASRLAPPHPFV